MTNIKEKKPKKKISKTNLFAGIIVAILTIGIICLCMGLVVLTGMLKDRPQLNTEDFVSEQSSQIFDKDGELIAEVGSVKRENISYDDLPNHLVDAFVAVEDSRFFTHPGFDISRFTKAMLENIKSLSFSQGGSTFTMQLVKYTYFMDDEAGVGAAKSIERKVQEISLALDLEKQINKKTIFELYLNKINFGGTGNIRGIQKASQYYFGKDVSELNLSESAMLAGVINAPNAYNPHNNLDLATSRRNQVLYLMNYHGYITDEEYELAKSIKVEDLLTTSTKRGNAGSGTPYQAYIDEVIAETIQLTGLDPTVTPMKIYTCMDPEVQSVMDDIQAGDVEGYFEYPDELFEVASISINNHTGEINGILGGRNYSYGGALLLNHATDQYNQPGSTIKPMLDYALAFENLGWSTSHTVVDRPIMWAGTDVIVTNANGKYSGEITLKDAVGNSLNTPAVLTLQEVIDKKSSAYVVEYMNNLGFSQVTTEDFNVQYGIGGSTFQVSVLQLASAQTTLLNGGVHVTPHTIRRIEFMNGKEPITPTYDSVQALSEEAAFLTTELLYNNVYGPYANLMQILKDNYPVYAKTGTTDWGNAGKPYGIPQGAAKDGWMIASTSDYTICTWIGYERAIKDQNTYLSNSKYLANIQGKVCNMLLDKTVELYGTPSRITKPNTVTSISHILGTYPYVSPIEGMDEKYISTGYIKSADAKLVSPENITIEQLSGEFKASFNGVTGELTLNWPTYPDESKLQVASEEMDISLKRSDGSVIKEATGTRLFDYSWVYGPIRYKADIKRNGNVVETVTSENKDMVHKIEYTFGDQFEICGYYAYQDRDVKSNSACKTFTIADEELSVTVPDSKKPLASIQEWAKAIGIELVYETIPTTDTSLVNTSVILNEKNENITGKTMKMKQSEIAKASWTCQTYTLEDAKIEISGVPDSPISKGIEVTLNANTNLPNPNDSNYSWTVMAEGIRLKDGTGSKIVFTTEGSGKYEITVTYDTSGKKVSATVSITVSE